MRSLFAALIAALTTSVLLAALTLTSSALAAQTAAAPPSTASTHPGAHPMLAKGTFEVKLAPLPEDDPSAAGVSGRMSLDKQFAGDIVGTSQGQMLTALTAQEGSAGYVAIETVTGSLSGKKGTFILQHSSTMNRGEPQQSITVVPDSATGDLAGLSGSLTIDIVDGQHLYEFEYSIEAP